MYRADKNILGITIFITLVLFLSGFVWADMEPNNSIQDAEAITLGQEITGTLDSSSDDFDYYNITLNADMDVIAKLNGPENADYDLRIYDTNGTKIAGTSDDWDADENIIFRTNATGYYFIGIWAYDGNGSYDLCVETPQTTIKESYTIVEAIENDYIEAEITGVYDGSEEVFDLKNGKEVFYGQCITIYIRSFVANDLEIIVPCGLKLTSAEEEVENKIITRTLSVNVKSLLTNETDIFAMSINMYKNIPVHHTIFEIGDMASGDLKKVADHINEHNHQTSSGQAAIWMISDDATSGELEQFGATSSIITAAETMLMEAGVSPSEIDGDETDEETTSFNDWILPLVVIIIFLLIIISILRRRPKRELPSGKQPAFGDMEAITPSEPKESGIPPPKRQPPTPPSPPPM